MVGAETTSPSWVDTVSTRTAFTVTVTTSLCSPTSALATVAIANSRANTETQTATRPYGHDARLISMMRFTLQFDGHAPRDSRSDAKGGYRMGERRNHDRSSNCS